MVKSKLLLISKNIQVQETVVAAFSESEVLFAGDFDETLRALDDEMHIMGIIIDCTNATNETIKTYAKLKILFDSMSILLIVNKNLALKLEKLGVHDRNYCVFPCDSGKLFIWARSFTQRLRYDTDSRALWERIFTKSPTGVGIIKNNDPHKSVFNYSFRKIMGRDPHEVVGSGWWSITHPEDVERERALFENIIELENRSFSLEKRIILPNGEVRWVSVFYNIIEYTKQATFTTLVIVNDITKFKELEFEYRESEASKQRIVKSLPGVVYRCKNDEFYTMVFISDMIYKLTGYTPEEIMGNNEVPFSALIAKNHQDKVREEWDKAIATKTMFRHQYEVVTKTGKKRWVLEQGEAIYDENGEVFELEGILIDITDLKTVEKNLHYKNLYDDETKLPNRKSFISDLSAGIPKNRTHTFITINLSDTKRTGSVHGHEYYINLRNNMAEKIKQLEIPRAKLYLTQEDHFTLHFRSALDEEKVQQIYETVIDSIIGTLRRETVRCGLGVTFATDDEGVDDIGEKILKRALLASETAHSATRLVELNYYTDALEDAIIREELLVKELRALMRSYEFGGLALHFQPVYELATDKIIGYEALARYTSPQFGYINPLELIGLAEKYRFSVVLGLKIFRLAFAFLARLKKEGHEEMLVSVNLSTTQLLDTMLADKLQRIANDYDVSLKNVILELTEHIYADNFEKLNESVLSLDKHGVRLSIDDFGTGYSSLSLIQELAIWAVKVDRTFVSKLNYENEDGSITREIISMCHKLVDVVVAEGVETKEQYEIIKTYNCDFAQGYYLARPMPEDHAIAHLKQHQKQK